MKKLLAIIGAFVTGGLSITLMEVSTALAARGVDISLGGAN